MLGFLLPNVCFVRLGEYRMPFGWSARQIFKPDGKLDPNTDFSPIYKFDDKKIAEGEMVKLLQDLRKGDKLSKLTVIPGTMSIKLSLMEVTTPSEWPLFLLFFFLASS